MKLESIIYGAEHLKLLSQEEIRHFNERGYVRLPKGFSAAKALAVQNRIWDIMRERHGVRRDDPDTWPCDWNHFSQAKCEPWANDLDPDWVLQGYDDLLGEGRWKMPKHFGAFLLGPGIPHPETPWHLPRGGWHWDGRPDMGLPGLWQFSLMSSIPSHGGGTLIVAGSHRLVCRFFDDLPTALRSRPTQRQKPDFLRRFDWFRQLEQGPDMSDEEWTARFMGEGFVSEGVSLRVVEVTGEPGDVIFSHPWIIHARPHHHGFWPRFLRLGVIERLN